MDITLKCDSVYINNLAGDNKIIVCAKGTELKTIIDQFETPHILEMIPENEINIFMDRKKENDL